MRAARVALVGSVLAQGVFSAAITRIGFVLFPGYQAIDAFGPLDFLNVLSWRTYLNVTILTADGLPVTTYNSLPAANKFNSTVGQLVIPTCKFADAPPLQALFVPGGGGTRVPEVQTSIDFVRQIYPSLEYLITVCTGAGIAARAGVLDGKNATTNKRAFYEIANFGPKTWWHSKARWVVDGNIWTSSGVAAGIDVTLAWIQHVWGSTVAEDLAWGSEYDWHRDSSWDPFSVKWNISDVISGVTLPPTATATPTPTPSSVTLPPVSTTASSEVVTTKGTKTTTAKTTKTTKTTKSTKTAKHTTTRKW